ncbi:uncharacterized protein LOC113468722 [Diaphorina citri]|uniref:Uncharacterized protein LOC113468722 n=1 Tax=Diaphorina citri TaxID=121845 RepID=A0A3Q0J3U0_DIACI|nr:uncharacterized protein LOC113468722 [Diaphorina citri]
MFIQKVLNFMWRKRKEDMGNMPTTRTQVSLRNPASNDDAKNVSEFQHRPHHTLSRTRDIYTSHVEAKTLRSRQTAMQKKRQTQDGIVWKLETLLPAFRAILETGQSSSKISKCQRNLPN